MPYIDGCQPPRGKITIFEGPDGCGKTTAATAFYDQSVNVRYVHFGPYKDVKKNLFRLYLEAMTPALFGQDVIMDRSWLSEFPYGFVYRGGANRLLPHHARMLERVAMSCGGMVVMCRPPLRAALENFSNRVESEMLCNVDQLTRVYQLYDHVKSELCTVVHNYTVGSICKTSLESRRAHDAHAGMLWNSLDCMSVGNVDGKFILVGDSRDRQTDSDHLISFPFVSYNGPCDAWLTRLLDRNQIRESSLYWISAEQDLSQIVHECLAAGGRTVIALGDDATASLRASGIEDFIRVDHPEDAMDRNWTGSEYDLMNILNRG